MKLPFIALALAICASLASAQADEPDAKPRIRPSVEKMRIPAGYTKEQLVLGDRIFNGEAAGGKCMTCHGADAKGTVVGTTDLTTGMYAWADGSVSGIKQGIADRMHTAPGMDGDLQPNDVVAVAVYVWSLAHQTH
jgi:mono/diheme cytochrome c family protein